jgi:hypothetical protein
MVKFKIVASGGGLGGRKSFETGDIPMANRVDDLRVEVARMLGFEGALSRIRLACRLASCFASDSNAP